MDYFESEGKTVEEALEKICDEHGLAMDEIDYTVVGQKKRVFGLIGSDILLVKAWRKSAPEKDPAVVLRQLCNLAGLDCKASSRMGENDTVLVDITGDDLGIIIGKNGEVLDALQYLTNKIANRGTTEPKKIVLDADGYRKRKIAHLRKLAARSAEQVRETGQSIVLNPMSARDRRIIHLELKEDHEVFTKSLGEGPFKKVMIAARKPQRDNARVKRRP